MINLSDLKLDKIRKTFNVDIDGITQEVVVFNILGERRQELKDKMVKLSKEGLDGDDLIEELYTEIFIDCTNIVVDEDIIEVINAPSLGMLLVMQEVYDIINEIGVEENMEDYQNLCQLESLEYTKLSLLKAEKVQLITNKCKEIENEIKEFQREVKEDGI